MGFIESAIFYITCFALSVYLFDRSVKSKKRFTLLLSGCIPVLISGLRYNVGTDYQNYIYIFSNMGSSISDNIKQGIIEPGFVLLAKISYTIAGNYYLVFFIASLLTILFTILAIRRLSLTEPALAYALCLFIFFPLSFNAVRQTLAIAIMFYAIHFLFEKRFWRYLILTVFASLFHTSAILLLCLYALHLFPMKFGTARFNMQIFRNRVALLPLFLILGYIIYANLPTLSSLGKYATYASQWGSGRWVYFLSLLEFALISMLLKRLYAGSKVIISYYYLMIIGILLATLGLKSEAAYRMYLYFLPYKIILLGSLPNIFNGNAYMKRTMRILVVFYGILYFIIVFGVYNTGKVFPYRSLLFQ